MIKLRKTIYSILCLMMNVCLISGCIEEYEADITSEDSDLLVVEGTICSGKLSKFTLSRTEPINAYYSPEIVKTASVSVRGTDGTEYRTESTEGHYQCQMGDLNPDVEYYLHIEIGDEVYESVPQKPLRSEKIADVCGVQSTPESNIDVLVTPAEPFEPDKANYYLWTYDVTWQVYPDFKTNIYYDTTQKKPVNKLNQFPSCGWIDAAGSSIVIGSSASYKKQHIQRLKLYDISRGNERLFYRYSGLVHQRSITKAEYEYEIARRQASSEMGGLFTPQPSALPTNIRCLTSRKHVIGYVGCSMNISEYRFFLNAKDFSIYRPSLKDLRVWLENPTDSICCEMVKRGYYLCEWEDPLKTIGGVLRTAWATEELLDVRCRYKGAYIEEPEFWSLTENMSY